jgi:membrane-anchored mycosin MYCP
MSAPYAARVLAVAALVTLLQPGVPVAQAVSPPRIEDKWLPEPAPAAPPRPTVQREVCATITADATPDRTPPPELADLPRVWPLTRGGGQRVAVIDTGVSRHPRLPGVVPGGDYVSAGDGTQDCDAHGTLVAGIINAVAPEATVIGIRQSSAKFAPADDRSRAGVGDVDTMAKAIRAAADLGASVITVSSVACVPADSTLDDRALGAALAYAVDVKNAVVVAAAGNTGDAGHCPPQRPDATWETVSTLASPAWYDDYVLTVGSVNADGMPSAFTLPGPWVDVAATGEAMTPLGSEPVSGTSYAASLVGGVAALIRARFPAWTTQQVLRRIESTAHHPPGGRDSLGGNGTIDVPAAVSTDTGLPATSPKPAPTSAPPPPQPSTPNSLNANGIAVRGASLCLLALTGLLATGAATRRLRASGNRVPRD